VKRVLGLLGWLGVVLVLAGVALRFLKPELQQWYQGLAIAGLVVTAIYTLSQWRDIARSFQGRNVKYGSIAFGGIVVVLGILVGINWIAAQQNKRWDLTAAKQFSLSDQTIKIVTELKKPVTARVYYDSGSNMLAEYKDRLGEYAHLSKFFSVEYIDAVKDPERAKQDGVNQYGTIVFGYDGRTERSTTDNEQDITNALIKAIEGKARKIYVVQGHDEHDTEGQDRDSYSSAATELKNDNFEVAKFVLAQEGKVPADATVVLVAGPKTDFLAPEIDLLRNYVKNGGELVILLDPPDKIDAPPLTNLIAFAKEWGVAVGNNLVVDASSVSQQLGMGAQVPLAAGYPGHPITSGFKRLTAYPLARSVTPIEGGTNGHIAQRVVETSKQSFAVADLKTLLATHKLSEPDAKKGDILGPVSIMVAVSVPVESAPPDAAPDAPKPEARIVIAGDSDFASNEALGFQGNKDMFLNTINWVAKQENKIAIRPHDPADRRIQLTEDQGRIIAWITLVIVPALLFLTGVWVWWKRR
jgi:ABC-type uncharacterized transport system involved in gliding motility auxiliary subunit